MNQIFLLSLFFLLNFTFLQAQNSTAKEVKTDVLFAEQQALSIKLSYSQKDLKKNTKDSLYTISTLSYQNSDNEWKEIEVKLKARGNFRRVKCYFPPVRIKIKASASKGTVFEGHKKLKLVLPCLLQKASNDNVLKEYVAYKIFEAISPFHFRTRMLLIDFTEIRKNKEKKFQLIGFLIEDEKKMAERAGGKRVERFVHPLSQEPVSSIRNALLQYMIGNVDFSTGYQHNQKLIYVNKRIITVPYDFDMCGFVDPSYGELPNIEEIDLDIENLRQRVYRGFVRNEADFQQVRTEYIANKDLIFSVIDKEESKFSNPKEFSTARNYITSFYKDIEDDKRFKKQILSSARLK